MDGIANTMTAADYLRRGVACRQAGRWDDAADCYHAALRLEPDFAEARYNLGILWRDLGRVDAALECLRATAAQRPEVAQVHFELANLLSATQHFDDALRHYQTAVALAPDSPAAIFNLGSLQLDRGRWHDAEASFREVLRLTPHDSDVWTNLGTALKEQGRLAAAESAYRRAVEHKPDHAAAWINLGTVRKDQGDLDAAVSCYQQAQAINPNLAAASSNLGNTWLELGQFERGLVEYTRAARLRPEDPRSYVDLANVLHRLGRSSQAIEAYQRAIQLDANCFDAWLNLGHLLRGIGDAEQAGALYRELSHRRPSDPLERLRVAANCPLVFRSRAELDQLRDEMLTVARQLAGAELPLEFARLTVAAPECPYNLQFLDGDLCPLKRAFAAVYENYFARRNRFEMPQGAKSGRWRVGFVVTARHESAFLKLLAGVVQRLDARQFEVVVLCSRLGSPRIRAGLYREDVQIVDFPERFDHIAEVVRRTNCDLLYYWEVGTDPTNYFLPFLRLAPVQVTCWGIQVTSGIPALDGYLSSTWVETPASSEHYTERLWCGSTLLTYQTPVSLPDRPRTRSDFGLASDSHVYGCVQNLGKFHPDFDQLLAAILRRDTKGVLVLGRDQHGFAAETLHRRWSQSMPDVLPRVVFVPPQLTSDYLSLLSQCNVLLDPMHFGGVTTTYDALALAKPVITLPTEFQRGRYTAACLRKVGVVDTIARDPADYVTLAVDFAADRDRCADLGRRMREAGRLAFEDQEAVLEHERIFHELLAPVR